MDTSIVDKRDINRQKGTKLKLAKSHCCNFYPCRFSDYQTEYKYIKKISKPTPMQTYFYHFTERTFLIFFIFTAIENISF